MKKQKCLIFLLVLGFFLSAFMIFGHADQSMAGNKMLIITTSKYAKDLNQYINWKIKRGLDVELDIRSAEKGAETIQRKLQEKHDHEGLTYIVLVGDIDDVETIGELFYKGTLAAMKNLSKNRGEHLFRRWHLFGDCSTRCGKRSLPNRSKSLPEKRREI